MTASHRSSSRFFHVPFVGGNPAVLPDVPSALSALKGGGYIWLNFLDPSREELMLMAGPLGLHPLAIEDCLDDQQIPKIEDYPTNTFILFNNFYYESNELFIDEIDLFIGRNFLVLVSHNLHDTGDFLDRLEQLAGLDRQNVLQGPDYLLHLILDYIVDRKFHTIDTLQDELDAVEEKILNDIALFRPEDLMRLRRNILLLRKSITHEREILVKICRRDSPFITEKSIYHFRDIYDHLAKFFEETEIYRELISGFMEMYLSMMNNRMTMMANKTNRVIHRLTMITTIFMPLTLLSGIGGMSEWSMMTGSENWRIAYPLFLLGMVVIGIVTFMLLRKIQSEELDE
jgi:magnesium transporter